MSNLEVFASAKTGLGLRCRNSVKRGTVVLSSEPFVYLLVEGERGRRCDYCFSKMEFFQICSGCNVMRYCITGCQEQDWIQHKPECAALQRVAPAVPPEQIILLGRVLWKLKRLSHSNSGKKDFFSVLDLESNYDKLTDEQRLDLRLLLVRFPEYWGIASFPDHVPSNDESLLHLMAILNNNQFRIPDELETYLIGTGVYLNCGLINHSCDPNCVVINQKLKTNICAIRDLVEGEEISISYVYLPAPTHERHEELKTLYGFECSCEACSSRLHDGEMLCDFDGNVLSLDSAEVTYVKDLLKDLTILKRKRRYQEIRNLASEYISKKVFPNKNIYMTRANLFAMNACLNLRRYKEALTYGVPVMKSLELFLPADHPMIGKQLCSLGKSLHGLSKYSEAMVLLVKSFNILLVTHGAESVIVQKLRQLMERCKIAALPKAI